MDGASAALLFGAGLAGGVVTAIVGGASLITFPALLATGLPAIVANASNSVALTPANVIAGLSDLRGRPPGDRALVRLIVVAVTGGVAGAMLLLVTPEKAFTAVVPVLIGLATVLFALSGRVRAWIARRARDSAKGRGRADGLGTVLFAPVAVYGGYFGAGMSVMLLAILSVSRGDEYRANNVVKNLLSGLTGLVAVVVFIHQGVVAWPATLITMAGGLIGGFLGGRLARVVPAEVARSVVITVGTVLTIVYAWRYW